MNTTSRLPSAHASTSTGCKLGAPIGRDRRAARAWPLSPSRPKRRAPCRHPQPGAAWGQQLRQLPQPDSRHSATAVRSGRSEQIKEQIERYPQLRGHTGFSVPGNVRARSGLLQSLLHFSRREGKLPGYTFPLTLLLSV